MVDVKCSFRPLTGNYISQYYGEFRYTFSGDFGFRPLTGNYISQLP